jgi:hypothetical protein
VQELERLVGHWQLFADTYVRTESLIYEWQNDMDARRMIHELLTLLPPSIADVIKQDLIPLDLLVREHTYEVRECIWGDALAIRQRYDRHTHWYYYRINPLVMASEPGAFTRL